MIFSASSDNLKEKNYSSAIGYDNRSASGMGSTGFDLLRVKRIYELAFKS